mmetsp:Transcript_39433/g.94845  ORF Transcript_39433/g.94845 Transcript_39433/m.94845 type:complete len:305 (-) Transcript_39433:413-1327(-)
MITTKGAARFHSNGFFLSHPSSAKAQAEKPTAAISMHGRKRLASCRDELERSWQGGSSTSRDFYCISSSESSDDNTGGGSIAKRRKTIKSNYSNDDDMIDCSFARGVRICQSNRPPSRPETGSLVKAGWYEGEVNALGLRHGKGVTKHDDGTEYEGCYVNDIMCGEGWYKFVTTKHMVPNPHQHGSHLHRQVEKSFKGAFKEDVPHRAGMVITKTVDWAPLVLGSAFDVRFREVVYDVGMHQNKAVGEGVRIIYTTTNVDGRSTLEKSCYRLHNGESTTMKVAPDYAAWMVGCMGLDFPSPSDI